MTVLLRTIPTPAAAKFLPRVPHHIAIRIKQLTQFVSEKGATVTIPPMFHSARCMH